MNECDLKDYLLGLIGEEVDAIQELSQGKVESIKALHGKNLKNAIYNVSLKSRWEKEGEKNIDIIYTGPIEKAIEEAERQFKKKNKRSDIQADYGVNIILGKHSYSIPEEYWGK